MGPGSADRIEPRLLCTAFILVLGTFMATLDTTIVSVGLDTLVADLDASVTHIQWVSTAYLLAVVTAVPMSGWLSDRFGGRRVWLAAVGVFLLGSVLCAISWSVTSLVAFRVVQGLGGGLLPPTGQALLARAAGPGRIGRILSIVGVIPLLSPALGPLIGGMILDVADWPWLFYVNVPVGVVAVLLAWRYVPDVPPSNDGSPFDIVGAALLSPGLAALVFGLTGASQGQVVRSAMVLVAVSVGLAMLVGFVVHGFRTRRPPLIDPRLFARPPFGAAALALVVLGASVFGAMFLLPLFLQDGRGMSAGEAGLLLGAQGVGGVVGSLVVFRVVDRVAARTLVLTGIGLVTAGTAPLTLLGLEPPDWALALTLLVRGLGAAMISTPVMNVVYSGMAPAHLPRASGALNLLNTVGGAVGTAAVAVVLDQRLAVREPLGEPGVTLAFADTFGWVLGLCLVAVIGASGLPRRVRGKATE